MSAFAVTLNDNPPLKSCLMPDESYDIQTKTVDLDYLKLSLDKLSLIAIDDATEAMMDMEGNIENIFKYICLCYFSQVVLSWMLIRICN